MEFPPKWIPDTFSDYCLICRRTWGFFWNRRHHCRKCGTLCCYRCSPYRIVLPPQFHCGSCPVRVCVECFQTPIATPVVPTVNVTVNTSSITTKKKSVTFAPSPEKYSQTRRNHVDRLFVAIANGKDEEEDDLQEGTGFDPDDENAVFDDYKEEDNGKIAMVQSKEYLNQMIQAVLSGKASNGEVKPTVLVEAMEAEEEISVTSSEEED